MLGSDIGRNLVGYFGIEDGFGSFWLIARILLDFHFDIGGDVLLDMMGDVVVLDIDRLGYDFIILVVLVLVSVMFWRF